MLAFLIAANFVPVYTNVGEHCDYTGSTRSWTRLPFGIRVKSVYEASLLEDFITENHSGELKHHWVSYQGTERNIYGFPLVRGHGRPNALFMRSEIFLKDFIAEAEPSAVKSFYDFLRTQSNPRVEARVEELMEDYGMLANKNRANKTVNPTADRL